MREDGLHLGESISILLRPFDARSRFLPIIPKPQNPKNKIAQCSRHDQPLSADKPAWLGFEGRTAVMRACGVMDSCLVLRGPRGEWRKCVSDRGLALCRTYGSSSSTTSNYDRPSTPSPRIQKHSQSTSSVRARWQVLAIDPARRPRRMFTKSCACKGHFRQSSTSSCL